MRVCIYEKTGGCCRSEIFSWQIGRPWPTLRVRSSPPSLTLPNCCIPCPSYTGISASSLTRLLLYTLLTPALLYNALIPASKQHRPHSSHNPTFRAKLPVSMSTIPPDTEILNPTDEEFYASYVSSCKQWVSLAYCCTIEDGVSASSAYS